MDACKRSLSLFQPGAAVSFQASHSDIVKNASSCLPLIPCMIERWLSDFYAYKFLAKSTSKHLMVQPGAAVSFQASFSGIMKKVSFCSLIVACRR